MSRNIPQDIRKIKEELKALKSFQELPAGQLATRAATATWQGVIDKTNPIGVYSILAAFEMTFVRTDGIRKPPLVDFAFLISPQIPNRRNYLRGNIVATGVNSVTYRITIANLVWWPYDTSTGTITIDGAAYSSVPGALSIERVFS
ncbi:hypothetical protein IIY66_00205 [Candidatus Saccharibacteria bacterium]|nr:hypothetical protein [Candidatus Saccharibacteria bacterium]